MLALAVLHGAFALSGSRATVRPRTGLRMSGKPRRVLAELPFAQARAMARSMGMSSRDEWEEYSCPGAYRLPNDPDVVWAADWQGWDDWLAQHVESTYPCRSLWLWAAVGRTGSCPGPHARRELSSPGWASRFPSKRRERRCVLLGWPAARSTRSSWRVAPSWSGRTRRCGTAATRFDSERRPLPWAWIRGGSQRCLTSSIVRSGLAGRTGLVQELIRETMSHILPRRDG